MHGVLDIPTSLESQIAIKSRDKIDTQSFDYKNTYEITYWHLNSVYNFDRFLF